MTHDHPRRRLTPAMRGVLDRMARAGRPPLHALTPQQARAFYEAGAGVLDVPPHRMAREEAVTITARDGAALVAELVVPHRPADAAPAPVLLYYHGGGFVVGSIRTHAALCRRLAHLAGCAVLSVDYRLAPEHRFPTSVHDAFDALAWLRDHAARLGLDPHRIAVGGDSAGGTLAVVTALQARDAGWPLALQVLFYPGCSTWQDTPSHRHYAHGFVLEAETIQWFFRQYIDDAQREDWRFAPLLAPDFEGVAPAWIGLAECDPLVDEGVMLADALRLARVPVDLEIYHGVTHEFIKMGRVIPEALRAHEDAARALRAALGTGSTVSGA
ncbi:alpha/beta hydrolase [Tepidimonas taiwanensis]|nr:alpha/beta hydrolase [Tepidimonas taiwanensis]MCX7692009.1 alpha/beta hydrolase [Tepidimonas taiwanensis]MDM7462436.1 alpha/beta hydrolase [Tepidimonas taiwanensis]UBQ06610.1 alpha/beta hydrolase [Tepidimonas taiwanensis]